MYISARTQIKIVLIPPARKGIMLNSRMNRLYIAVIIVVSEVLGGGRARIS